MNTEHHTQCNMPVNLIPVESDTALKDFFSCFSKLNKLLTDNSATNNNYCHIEQITSFLVNELNFPFAMFCQGEKGHFKNYDINFCISNFYRNKDYSFKIINAQGLNIDNNDREFIFQNIFIDRFDTLIKNLNKPTIITYQDFYSENNMEFESNSIFSCIQYLLVIPFEITQNSYQIIITGANKIINNQYIDFLKLLTPTIALFLNNYINNNQSLERKLYDVSCRESFETSKSGLAIINKNFNVIKCNAQFLNFQSAYENNNLTNASNFLEFIIGNDHKRLLYKINQEKSFSKSICFKGFNNKDYVTYVEFKILYSDSNGNNYYFLKLKDITNRQELLNKIELYINELEIKNEKLKLQNKKVLEANNLKNLFLATITHELKNPLNSIIGYSEILQNEFYGNLNTDQKEYVYSIKDNGANLLNLINDIIDLAKIETGNISLKKDFINPQLILDSVLKEFKTEIEAKDLTIRNNLDIESVYADPKRLKQIFSNLISNATKFNIESGYINIYAREKGPSDKYEFFIEDSGIGINPQDQDKIFNLFQQLDSKYSRHYEGAGVGLSLVKKLVEEHKGSVKVNSKPGQGSVFSFTIPQKEHSVRELRVLYFSNYDISEKTKQEMRALQIRCLHITPDESVELVDVNCDLIFINNDITFKQMNNIYDQIENLHYINNLPVMYTQFDAMGDNIIIDGLSFLRPNNLGLYNIKPIMDKVVQLQKGQKLFVTTLSKNKHYLKYLTSIFSSDIAHIVLANKVEDIINSSPDVVIVDFDRKSSKLELIFKDLKTKLLSKTAIIAIIPDSDNHLTLNVDNEFSSLFSSHSTINNFRESLPTLTKYQLEQ